MAHMVRNDSASVISSLQMDYGDSDEEDYSSSRNNSTDTKDVLGSDSLILNDNMDIDNDDEENNSETDIKKDHDDDSKEQKIVNKVKEENMDLLQGENYIISDTGTVENLSTPTDLNLDTDKLKPDPLPFTKMVQINAAPVVDDDDAIVKEEESSPTALDEAISDDEHEDGIHDKQKSKETEIEEEKAVQPVSKEVSPAAQTLQKKPTRLVSYGPDEDFDEDTSDSDSEVEVNPEDNQENSPALPDPSALSRSFQNMSGEDIKIPPEPPGNCSRLLQNKIEDMYDRMRREGLDLNKVIQKKKSFRNPSIYEKLIDFCNIDQKGTNFPPEIYDPHIWGKESYYDELDKAQRKDMERREKEKRDKTKIEFVVGTKKSSSDGSSHSDEKKRKSKWDTQPSGMVKSTTVQGPGVVNLTATATGTKATVISALGSLSKKSSK